MAFYQKYVSIAAAYSFHGALFFFLVVRLQLYISPKLEFNESLQQ